MRSPSPSANRISVVLGARDTMRRGDDASSFAKTGENRPQITIIMKSLFMLFFVSHTALQLSAQLQIFGKKLCSPFRCAEASAHGAGILMLRHTAFANCSCFLRIERELELLLPIKVAARLAHLLIAHPSLFGILIHITYVSRDLCSLHSLANIVLIRESQMLCRRDIADQVRAVAARLRSTDGRGNMVEARSHVGGDGTQHIVGSAATHPFLELDVSLDLVHGHMTRPFDQHLAAHIPADLREFAVDEQFLYLRTIGRVVDRPRPESVAEREDHV